MMGAKVKAIRTGFYGGVRRRIGDVFTLKDGDALGSWMSPVGTDEVASESKPRKAAKGPATFSEITKIDAKALTPKGADDLV